MQQEIIQKLFGDLKKCKYSTGRMRKFKNLVHRLELKLRGKKVTIGNITKYNITPTEFFIRHKKLSKKYIIANNTLKKFTILQSVKVLPNSIVFTYFLDSFPKCFTIPCYPTILQIHLEITPQLCFISELLKVCENSSPINVIPQHI